MNLRRIVLIGLLALILVVATLALGRRTGKPA